MAVACNGDTVVMHYTCIAKDNLSFSSRDMHKPISFSIGQGKMLKALEDGVLGMHINETKRVKVPHQEAYGSWRKELIHKIDRAIIPESIDLGEGLELYLNAPDGREIKVKIIQIQDDFILIDENHFLAGKDLDFEIELIEIIKSDEDIHRKPG